MLSLIVAMARNRVIGRANTLPWHLPSELKFFKQTTMGKPIIMGRKTHQSIARLLPGRSNIIVTRDEQFQITATSMTDNTTGYVVHSLEAALHLAQQIAPDKEHMLIGGADLYRQSLPLAQRIYLTLVEADIEGDTWFPALDWEQWQEVWKEYCPADERHDYAHSRILLQRIEPINA